MIGAVQNFTFVFALNSDEIHLRALTPVDWNRSTAWKIAEIYFTYSRKAIKNQDEEVPCFVIQRSEIRQEYKISCNNNSNNQISIVERVGNEIVAAGKKLDYLIA